MADVSRTPGQQDDVPRLAPGTYELTKRIEVTAEDGTFRFVDMPDGPDAENVAGFWPSTRTQVRKIEQGRSLDTHITDDMVKRAAEAMEDAAVTLIGRDLGTIHRDEIAAAGLSAALAGCTEQPAGAVDELAARVLDDHLLAGPLPGQCRCGWGDGSDVRTLGRSHSKHVVGQLRAAGALAMVAAGSQVGDQHG